MALLTLRRLSSVDCTTKNAPLTNLEVDTNFNNLVADLVNIDGRITALTPQLNLSQGEYYAIETNSAGALIPVVDYFDYSSVHDRLLIVGGSRIDDNYINASLFNIPTLAPVWNQIQSPRSRGRLVSSDGSISDEAEFIVSYWVTPGTASDRIFYWYSQSTYANLGNYNVGNLNYHVASESENRVLLFGTSTARDVNKGDKTVVFIANPSGYSVFSSEFAIYTGTHYLASANKAADSGVAFTKATPGVSPWSTPIDVGDLDGNGIFTAVVSQPLIINNQVWWMATRGSNPSYRTMFIITDLDGNVITYKPVYDGNITYVPNTSNQKVLYSYSDTRNSIYYNYGNEFWEHNLDFNSYSSNTPALPAGLSGYLRLGGPKIVGDYLWSVLYDTSAIGSGWGVERVYINP